MSRTTDRLVRLAGIAGLLLAAAGPVTSGGERSAPPAQAAAGDPASAPQSEAAGRLEVELWEQINEVRTSKGLGPLVRILVLDRVARRHSRDMAARDYFDHTSPGGETYFDRLAAAGFRYAWAGENIFLTVNQPPARIVELATRGWLKSPGHRGNILRPQFTQTGLGAWSSGRKYYLTQAFARPR
jgi:uncharacterized protein YkwD